MRTSPLFASQRHVSVGLAILRVIAGIIFLAHGWQKLFVFGLGGTTGAFTQMGIPLPGFTGPFVAAVELVGGIALILGLLTRIAGFVLAADMLGAILLVHARNGFFLPTGVEFALSMFAAAVTMGIAGPGAFSLDSALASGRSAAAREPMGHGARGT